MKLKKLTTISLCILLFACDSDDNDSHNNDDIPSIEYDERLDFNLDANTPKYFTLDENDTEVFISVYPSEEADLTEFFQSGYPSPRQWWNTPLDELPNLYNVEIINDDFDALDDIEITRWNVGTYMIESEEKDKRILSIEATIPGPYFLRIEPSNGCGGPWYYSC